MNIKKYIFVVGPEAKFISKYLHLLSIWCTGAPRVHCVHGETKTKKAHEGHGVSGSVSLGEIHSVKKTQKKHINLINKTIMNV